MAKIKIDKVVSVLPNPLIPNTVYAVRVGNGYDLYISDSTGAIAHTLNSESGFLSAGNNLSDLADLSLSRTNLDVYSKAESDALGGGGGGGVASSQDIISLLSSANQSANATTDIAVQWDTEEVKDTSFTHSISTNNSRITVTDDGSYSIKGVINYTGSTSNYRYTSEVAIRVNGSIIKPQKFKGSYIRAFSANSNTGNNYAIVLKLTAGDYIEILTKRISDVSGNATITVGTNISMIKLSGTKGDNATFTTGTAAPNDADGEVNGNVYYQTV